MLSGCPRPPQPPEQRAPRPVHLSPKTAAVGVTECGAAAGLRKTTFQWSGWHPAAPCSLCPWAWSCPVSSGQAGTGCFQSTDQYRVLHFCCYDMCGLPREDSRVLGDASRVSSRCAGVAGVPQTTLRFHDLRERPAEPSKATKLSGGCLQRRTQVKATKVAGAQVAPRREQARAPRCPFPEEG